MALSSLFRRRRDEDAVKIDVERIERYWRHARSGDPDLEAYERARRLSGSNDNFFKQNRFYTLARMVARLVDEKVPGDVVECGCFKGHSTYMVAERLQAAGWPGRFFVFDSFEGGLSDRVVQDRSARGDTTPQQTFEWKTHFASSRDEVAALLQPFPFVSLHGGWIPGVFDDVPGLRECRFALAHIDVDLYEPTRDSLAFLGPRMSDGGVIVVDDYGSSTFPGSKVAVDEFLSRTKPRFFVEGHLMGAVMLF